MLLQDYKKLFEHTDQVKAIFKNGQRVWPTVVPIGPDYTEPFYAENISNVNETISIQKAAAAAPTLTIEYSTDKTTWTPFENPTSTTALTKTLAPGDKIYLRCSANAWGNNSGYTVISGVSKVGGNIMSLLYGSNFTGREKSFPSGSTYNFYYLFNNNTKLVNASNLLLPATTLALRCYQYMFFGCTALTDPPAIPATTLTENCYYGMFYSCKSLTQAPALPATTLATGCYYGMFYNANKLNSITCLATNISASDATSYWLSNVSSTGTFTKAAGVTWSSGVSGIPSGWTIVEV